MATNMDNLHAVANKIAAIREEHNTDERIRMLRELNNSLPVQERIELPALITNAYIRRALDIILEGAMKTAMPA